MKKMYKAMLLVLCAVLLVAGSVMGTLAYLQDSKTITNTMSVGSVTITMDETDVDVYGVQDGTTRVMANTYKLIPGREYTKDPIIHVTSGSESCYLFVKLVNGIEQIEDTTKTINSQMQSNGWLNMTGNNTVWYKPTAVDARNGAKDVAVFSCFKISGNEDISGYAGKTIQVTAYAVQADGFTSAEAAWNATFGASNP